MIKRLTGLLLFSASLLILLNKPANCQNAGSSLLGDDTIVYNRVSPSTVFPGYDTDNLVIDYFYSFGFSTIDRYSYELVLVNSLLTVNFNSQGTENFNHISYQKEIYLSATDVNKLQNAIVSCGLKQIRSGIPEPDATGNEQDVLILKSDNTQLSGGLFSYTITDLSDTSEYNNERAKERSHTTSIGGDYDRFFKLFDSYFPGLNSLLLQVAKKEK